MIPKKIHYCWLGGNPLPASTKKYIDTWRRLLPDYEIIQWDESNFDTDKIPWTKEAIEAKKYAFAADYIRCHVLYHEGGIYLDTDVELLKPFDDLLDLPYFLGLETPENIGTGIMGAEKGNKLFKRMVDYYTGRHFNVDGKLDTLPIPDILTSMAKESGKMMLVNSPADIKTSDYTYILPQDFFSPKSWQTGEINLTENSYTIHHFDASWLSKDKRKNLIKRRKRAALKKKLGKLYHLLQIGKHLLNRPYKAWRQNRLKSR